MISNYSNTQFEFLIEKRVEGDFFNGSLWRITQLCQLTLRSRRALNER